MPHPARLAVLPALGAPAWQWRPQSTFWPFFLVSNAPGPFRYAQLSLLGQGGIAIELLATIAVLYGLEPSLRNSHGSVRWRLKYLALGVGGIFAVRFYLLSQVLLFRLRDRQSLLIGTIALIIELVVALGPSARAPSFDGLSPLRLPVHRGESLQPLSLSSPAPPNGS
jgi:hypothetical protein